MISGKDSLQRESSSAATSGVRGETLIAFDVDQRDQPRTMMG